jgi:acyl-coenzyme A thioesterase PaaI-like protein
LIETRNAPLDSEPLLRDDGMCFACGKNNPIGLRLEFDWDGERYSTRYVPDPAHQGWAGRTHGGFIALVLDEVLSRVVLTTQGMEWVTVELSTRLVRPIPTGRPVDVVGRIESVRSKLITAVGEVIDVETGQTVATGHAKLMKAR